MQFAQQRRGITNRRQCIALLVRQHSQKFSLTSLRPLGCTLLLLRLLGCVHQLFVGIAALPCAPIGGAGHRAAICRLLCTRSVRTLHFGVDKTRDLTALSH